MMNDSPRCYPLHFAIDKERVEIVKKFVKELNKEEMEKMVDG